MLFTDSFFLFYFLPSALIIHYVGQVLFGGKGGEYSGFLRITIFGLTLFFYGARQPWWLLPFCICIVFDFIWATLLTRTQSPRLRKLICALSITQNLSLLGLLKYLDFIRRTLDKALPGVGAWIPELSMNGSLLSLPAGISFYTFESLSFVIDVYRRQIRPPRNPLEFFAFIGMFPRFVAGPIVRYRDMISQFKNYAGMQLEPGLFLFAFGFVLKACFADSFAKFTGYAFGRMGEIETLAAWIGAVSYGLQIYFDFCGYSLMAIGIGRCFGFTFPQNFNKPYYATSLQDFWRRWHISLSSWLRDYLYIPLGGSRYGVFRTYVSLFLTMLLGGIWHGADWTFVIWGAWHGLFLCLERALRVKDWLSPVAHRMVTLWIVLTGWVFFRADKLPDAFKILRGMFLPLHRANYSFNPEGLVANPVHLVLAVMGILYLIFVERFLDMQQIEKINMLSWKSRAVVFAWFACSLLLVFSARTVPFIYFQF